MIYNLHCSYDTVSITVHSGMIQYFYIGHHSKITCLPRWQQSIHTKQRCLQLTDGTFTCSHIQLSLSDIQSVCTFGVFRVEYVTFIFPSNWTIVFGDTCRRRYTNNSSGLFPCVTHWRHHIHQILLVSKGESFFIQLLYNGSIKP